MLSAHLGPDWQAGANVWVYSHCGNAHAQNKRIIAIEHTWLVRQFIEDARMEPGLHAYYPGPGWATSASSKLRLVIAS